jgi:hypothetical protein
MPEIGLKTALIIVFVIYGVPFWRMRYRWRATIYRMSDWKINILPWFGRDTVALFSNRYFRDEAERRMARRYRAYVLIYIALLLWIIWLP